MNQIARHTIVLVILSSSSLAATVAPVAVSPGTSGDRPGSIGPCPTFNWSGVPEAAGYEIVVYPTDGLPGDPPSLYRRLPAGSTGWTPALESCLSSGASYAWTVRAVVDRDPQNKTSWVSHLGAPGGEWAEPLVFRVPEGPSAAEVERALEVLRRWRETDADSETGLAAAPPDAAPAPPREEPPRLATASSSQAAPETDAPYHPQDAARSNLEAESVGTLTALAADSFSLSLEGHVDLGGAIFKGGAPLLHNHGTENTAVGAGALAAVDGGLENTAVGHGALTSNSTGMRNVAVGDNALAVLREAQSNVAIGHDALRYLDLVDPPGVYATAGNIAVGAFALDELVHGVGNTAVGDQALSKLHDLGGTAGGWNNVALGYLAGVALTEGDDNIYIGSSGASIESETIRIGNPTIHTRAFLAGQVAIGGTSSPANQLLVEEAVDDDSVRPGGHVVLFTNTSATDTKGPDVLALRVEIDDPDADTNFITFFDDSGDIGAIEGNGGGISLNSTSADFAEYLPKANPEDELAPGDVVGLFGAGLSHRTEGADRVLVVTTAPIVSGGDPGPERQALYARVAFLGQVPVRLRGPAREGDYLVASGREDGTAVALGEEDLMLRDLPRVIGRALTSTPQASGTVRAFATSADAPATVPALVGLPGPTLRTEVRELERLRDEVAELRERLAELER